MTHIIAEPCIGVKDTACVDVCPVDCIYGKLENGEMLYIHPEECIDCGLCVDACPVEAIYPDAEVPDKWKSYIAKNYEYFGLKAPESEEEGEEDQILLGPEFLALTIVGGKVRLVSLRGDGEVQFIDPTSKLHNLLYAFSFERAALQQAVEEFEALINDPKITETELHRFFEGHPDFILSDDYKKAHSKIVLERNEEGALIPDFVLEPFDSSALSDLLELKLPSARVYVLKKNRVRFSAAVLEAVAQLREYSNYFEEQVNRERVRSRYGLLSFRPRMFVVIGRSGNVNPLDIRKSEEGLARITLRTYDDILGRMKRKLIK